MNWEELCQYHHRMIKTGSSPMYIAMEDFDKIRAVVDAAQRLQKFTHWGMASHEVEASDELTEALKGLEIGVAR